MKTSSYRNDTSCIENLLEIFKLDNLTKRYIAKNSKSVQIIETYTQNGGVSVVKTKANINFDCHLFT